jgi:ribosome-binding ATPase YchF (GTP1/OBG family)
MIVFHFTSITEFLKETEVQQGNAMSTSIFELAKKKGIPGLCVSAKIEEEVSCHCCSCQFKDHHKIANMDAEAFGGDKTELLKSLNLESSGLSRIVSEAYKLLGLSTFYTAGEQESRAWTITRNTKAREAAAEIHSDIAKGFIKAETVSYEDYIKNGGESGAKVAGKLRMEGPNYIVQDGLVILKKNKQVLMTLQGYHLFPVQFKNIINLFNRIWVIL